MVRKSTNATVIICLLVFLIACSREIPEPELKLPVVLSKQLKNNYLPATSAPMMVAKEDSFFVHHYLNGEDVFIECIVKGVSFRDEQFSTVKQGKIVVYLNGKKKTEVRSAAFILKGLPPGEHNIKLEVVSPENQTYDLKKEFSVSIPS